MSTLGHTLFASLHAEECDIHCPRQTPLGLGCSVELVSTTRCQLQGKRQTRSVVRLLESSGAGAGLGLIADLFGFLIIFSPAFLTSIDKLSKSVCSQPNVDALINDNILPAFTEAQKLFQRRNCRTRLSSPHCAEKQNSITSLLGDFFPPFCNRRLSCLQVHWKMAKTCLSKLLFNFFFFLITIFQFLAQLSPTENWLLGRKLTFYGGRAKEEGQFA